MLAAEGILTARGGLVSHAAVVARGWGKPAVVGAEAVRISGPRSRWGTPSSTKATGSRWMGPTGPSCSGRSRVRGRDTARVRDHPELGREIRAGHLGGAGQRRQRAGAANARRHGAEGIGLCRTEHMFLAEDRLPIVQQMILAATPPRRSSPRGTPPGPAVRLRRDPRGHGRPAGDHQAARPAAARVPPEDRGPGHQEGDGGVDSRGGRLYEAALAWHEYNPMLGTRGVRLGVIKPGLYAMQVRALMEAALDRVAAGGRPIVEIMIPLTVSREELALARSWVEAPSLTPRRSPSSRPPGQGDQDTGRADRWRC